MTRYKIGCLVWGLLMAGSFLHVGEAKAVTAWRGNFQQEGAAPHDSFQQVGAAQRQQQNKALRDSLKQAVQLLSFHPDSVDLLLKKASWNVCLEEWSYAKDTYDKVLFLEPSNVAALYYRAYVNERMGRYNFARLDYEHLLYIVPGHF